MKEQLYRFVDTYEGDDSDLTFLISSNADVDTMESIELVSTQIWNEVEDKEDMPELNEYEQKLYDKYFEEYAGCSKIEIIECIVKEEGYTWNSPDIIDIEW